jgi:hypothetical protein
MRGAIVPAAPSQAGLTGEGGFSVEWIVCSEGHADESPSTVFASPSLRYGPFGMTASRRHGKWLPCPLVSGAAQKSAPLTKGHAGKRPSARGAVKTGEAAREAGCLDGEHGDGSATVAGMASARGAPFPVSHVSKSTAPAAGRAVRGKRKVAESEMQLGCALPFDVMAGLVPRLSGSARPVVNLKSHTTPARRARACPGHPRRAEAANFKGLLQQRGVRTNARHSPWDSRDKPSQDAERFYST